MAKICDRMKGDSLIGDVRGKGLMIGVELVKDDNKTPASQEAETIRAECLKTGVLIGVGGIYGNVLRLQPPLTIAKPQLDRALDTVLSSLYSVGREHTTTVAR
jgi:4-aminobutyrate aminotransferase-like enzyme